MAEDSSVQRFFRVKEIFLGATGHDRNELAGFLERECGGNRSLREEVELLLTQNAAYETGSNIFEEEPFSGDSRFSKLEKLGSGGFGDVYKVFDRKLHVTVALKTLRMVDPAGIERFKKEFRAAARIYHENVAQVYDLIFDEARNCWFFTMELIDGRDVLSYIGRGEQQKEDHIRNAFVQLAQGIVALHRVDILHRDLKPSNMLVTDAGRVVLLDFGLAREVTSLLGSRSMSFAGTPDYISPEAIAGEPVGKASDWYSFGVILYEALCGRRPFEGSVLEVFQQKRACNGVRVELPNAPEDLRLLCEQLLARDASMRPPESEVLRILQGNRYARSVQPEQGSYPPFVGRHNQLKSLNEAIRLTEWGRGITIHMHGPSGIGKTALARRFLEHLNRENGDALVLRARCYESELVPYKAVDDLVERLSRHLRRLPPQETSLLLPRYFESLARLFPSLKPLTALTGELREQAEMPDSHEFRRRAFVAIRELLARLADRRPLVLFIDDVHWGDQDSATLLNEVMKGPEPPALLLLLVYRSDEIDLSKPIQLLREPLSNDKCLEIQLGPLETDEAEELSRKLLTNSNTDEQTVSEISRTAEGNPFLIEQLSIHFRSRRQSVSRISAEEILRERIAATGGPARRFLEALAIAAAPLDLSVIGLAACLGEDLLPAKAKLLGERLIRSRGPAADKFDIYHDGLRTAALSWIPLAERQDWHGRLALALEQQEGDAETIAFHYEQAGNNQKAMRFAEIAANKAESVMAFYRAAGIYRFMLKLGVSDAMRQRDINRNLGEALINAGQGSAAAEAYLEAAQGSDSMDALRLRIKASAALLRAGEVDAGAAHLLKLLHETGMSYPETMPSALATLAVQRFRLWVRGSRASSPSRPLGAAIEATREGCWAAAVGTSMVNPIDSGIFCARYLRMALNSDNPTHLALGYAAEATQRAHIDDGRQDKARHYLRLAQANAETAGDPHTKGFVLAMTAVVDSLGARWDDCVSNASTSIRLLRDHCRGVDWEVTTATTFLFSSRYILGRWRENEAELPAAIQAARQRGDKYATANLQILGISYIIHLVTNKPTAALEEMKVALAEWPHKRTDVQQLYTFFARVEILLYMGNGKEAWKIMNASWSQFWYAGLLRITLARAFGVSLRGRAALAAGCEELNGSKEQRRLFALSRRCASHLERLGPAYADGTGKLLRAGIEISSGNIPAAAEHLQTAEALLAGLAPWVAVTRLRLAGISEGPKAARLHESALDWFNLQRVAKPTAIGDMFCPGHWDRVKQSA